MRQGVTFSESYDHPGKNSDVLTTVQVRNNDACKQFGTNYTSDTDNAFDINDPKYPS